MISFFCCTKLKLIVSWPTILIFCKNKLLFLTCLAVRWKCWPACLLRIVTKVDNPVLPLRLVMNTVFPYFPWPYGTFDWCKHHVWPTLFPPVPIAARHLFLQLGDPNASSQIPSPLETWALPTFAIRDLSTNHFATQTPMFKKNKKSVIFVKTRKSNWK